MKEGKELPITLDIDFTVNLMDCLPLCIIFANSGLENWVNQNFMLPVACLKSADSLEYIITDGVKYGANYQNPEALLRHSFICGSAMQNIECITDFMIERINMDWYGIIFIDQYYVEGLPSFHKRHFSHEVLIYGYDLKKRIFNAIAYARKMCAIEISFDALEKSFREVFSVPGFTEEGWHEYTLMLYQFVKHTESYPFEKDIFENKLAMYMKGVLPDYLFFEKLLYMRCEKQQCFFGIKVTEAMLIKVKSDKDLFINAIEKEEKYLIFELYSAVHIYAEFYKALFKKIKVYIRQQDICSESKEFVAKYGEIVKASEQIRMLYLKLEILAHKREDAKIEITLNSIIEKLEYIKEEEPVILKLLLC